MKSVIFCLLSGSFLLAQSFQVEGYIHDSQNRPLVNVRISVEGTPSISLTDFKGYFQLTTAITSQTTRTLEVVHPQYNSLKIPLNFSVQQELNLGVWQLTKIRQDDDDMPLAELNQLQLDNAGNATTYGSFLQSQRSLFLQTAAFQFRDAYFQLRGLGSTHQEIQFNGLPMQDFSRGRPSWNSWGGLNQFTNSAQEVVYGIQSDPKSFGGLLGSAHLWVRPSLLRKGNRFSLAASNALYQYRSLYSKVFSLGDDLHLAFHLGLRYANSGYRDGTPYRSISTFFALEKNWNLAHSSQITAVYTPQRRGKSAPLTQEVFDLAGARYNPYWGKQKGKIRNSRMREQSTPFVVINHFWTPSEQWETQFSLGYRWGVASNSRLNYGGTWPDNQTAIGGAENPDPTYYQKMPSYALRDTAAPDYQGAYLKLRQFQEHPQLDWHQFWATNRESPAAIYALVNDEKHLNHASFQWQTQWRFSPHWMLSNVLNIQSFRHIYRNTLTDLLGGNQWYDLDRYNPDFPRAFNDLQSGQAPKGVGDPLAYHYGISGFKSSIDLLMDYHRDDWVAFLGFRWQSQTLQRDGRFQNGRFPQSSFGKGDSFSSDAFGLKFGVEKSLWPFLRLNFRASWRTQPLWIDQSFVQPRIRNLLHPNSDLPTYATIHFGADWRRRRWRVKLQSYWMQSRNERSQNFYFADGLGGDNSLFVQELISGIETRRWGIESSLRWEFITDIFLETVAFISAHQYANNPALILASEPSEQSETVGFQEGIWSADATNLKGYYLGGSPQQAYSISLKYQDPAYWTLQLYSNIFRKRYISPNPLTRTSNFYTANDGTIFSDYNPQLAQQLLAQEQLADLWLWNLVFRKSWKIDQRYISLFMGINNLANRTYKSGGFEQARNANYQNLLEDRSRRLPLFGTKYWWSMGTTYFISLNYSWN